MNNESTEKKIKMAAHKIFVQKGLMGARMQEIADEAGINKALLHYYYRSKDQLFNAVFEEVIFRFFPNLVEVLNSDLALEDKISQVAVKYTELLTEHREMPLFILNELQSNPDRIANKLPMGRAIFTSLEKQLKNEHEKGNIREISLEMFIMNIISLMVFPFVGKPLYQRLMQMDEQQYTDFLDERSREVPAFIMNALKP